MITDMQIRTAADGTAWKTATMRGYLFKTKLDEDTYGKGAYTLTFREAANSSGGTPVDHVFYFDFDPASSGGASVVQGSVTLGLELLNHILNSQWQSGKASDFELVRDGTGRTW